MTEDSKQDGTRNAQAMLDEMDPEDLLPLVGVTRRKDLSWPPRAPGSTPPVSIRPACPLDVKIEEELGHRALTDVFQGTRGDGTAVMVTVLSPTASEREAKRFAHGARLMQQLAGTPGILAADRVADDERSFVSPLHTMGSSADLSALHFKLARKIVFIKRICEALQAVHKAGAFHGCLCPSNILLDDDLNPVLSEVGLIDVGAGLHGDKDGVLGYGLYAAPEVKRQQTADRRSDIFSLGRFLAFVLLGVDPEQETADLPRLEALAARAPAGLVHIVRKCCAAEPLRRYADISAFLADLGRYAHYETVGLPLADVKLQNLSGTMDSQPPPPVVKKAIPEIAAPKPKSAPEFRLEPSPDPSTPSSPAKRIVLTSIVAFGAVMALVLLNPLPDIMSAIRRRKLDSSDVAERALAVRTLVAGGDLDFHKVALSGADLTRLDLSGAWLADVDFTNANLQNSKFKAADLAAAKMGGAQIQGADFTGAVVPNLTGFESAHCDSATVMPDRWLCVDEHPRQGDNRPTRTPGN